MNTLRHRVALALALAVAAGACAPATGARGTLYESPSAPIPLRAGYWAQPEFQDARFTGGGLEGASFGDIMSRGLVGLARSSFRGSAEFQSREEAMASPLVDVIIAPTIDTFTMAPDPEVVGPRDIATVRMQWQVSDKTGRVLWSNLVVTQRRETCLVTWCRKEFAERAVREHFEAAGAELRSLPWWQRPR